jgi:hypothetical protein
MQQLFDDFTRETLWRALLGKVQEMQLENHRDHRI